MKEQHRLYTAGQLAKMYSLKKDTILYYDRIGLFCPEGRAENGYRQYSHSQLTELDAILGMRELGMPIASIRQAITGTDIPSFTALLESERHAVEAKISSLKERSQVLTSMIATIDKACGSPKEVLFFEKRPSCHIVTADIVYEDGMGLRTSIYDHTAIWIMPDAFLFSFVYRHYVLCLVIADMKHNDSTVNLHYGVVIQLGGFFRLAIFVSRIE